MADLGSVLTSAQNIASAINDAAQAYLRIQGANNTANISAATVVKASAGRVAVVSVTVAGAATGLIYDAASLTGAASQLYPIYVVPMAVGVVSVNLPTNYGIVVAPGSGQHITVSWS